jgi:hypothetical protein
VIVSRSSAEPASALGRFQWSPEAKAIGHPRATLALWGLAVALLATLALISITPRAWPMNDGRGIRLRDSMTVLEHGGPLLLGRHGPQGHLYAVDFGDDEGIFVYIPLLSRLFGVADPVSMLRYLYIALVALTAAFYPMIFYQLTRSLLAGIAAPLMFLVCILSMGFFDLYWIPAWGALALFPLIFLLARDWPRFGLLAIAAISLAASWLSSIRGYSGLGIALAAAIVLLLRRWQWWRLLPALVMLAIIYISINTFVFSAIRADRDHRLGSAAKTVDLTTGHTLWHTAYAGLGYLPNKYGLRFLDSVSVARVEREAPGTPFLSSHYETVIRKAYFSFLGEHPLEALRQYAGKLIVTIADAFPYLLIVLLTLPAALLLSPDRRMVGLWSLLAIPGVIAGILPILLALPMQWYELGHYGVIGVVGIIGSCELLKLVEMAARAPSGVQLRPAGVRAFVNALTYSRTPGWRSVRVSMLAVAMLIALAYCGYLVRQEANRWQGGPSGVLMERIT